MPPIAYPVSAQVTPIVVNGVMYLTAIGRVVALDPDSGKEIWSYPVNGLSRRGVAYVPGEAGNAPRLVFTAGRRLIALNAKDGTEAWSAQTVDPQDGAVITGAPRVFNGKVVIGFSGGDFSPLRGYVTAYDAATGAQKWRWFTVPGDPSKPFENEAMARAAKTWDASGKWWESGGGGTVWDAMAYDPETDLLYFGTGNGTPWNRKQRSEGFGDNLFLSSIVAVKAKTGEYAWHYQHTPADDWDYDSTNHIILADLKIDGKDRKVVLQAPKNGVFYVLDRVTGEFISAGPFSRVNWAKVPL
mgnify:CR=1 FL=1